MDKKKLLIGIAAVAAAVLAIVLIRPGKAETPESTPAETTLAATETETTATVEETTEPADFANEALEGEPAPFANETVITVPGSSNSNKTSQSGGNSGTSGNNKPQSGNSETLPPDVNVSMGVVEGEKAEDIDDGVEDNLPTPNTKPTESPKPTEPPKPTQPVNSGSSALGSDFDFTSLTYESYNAMTGAQQQEVIGLFSSPDEFVRWYKAAEAQYKVQHPDIEIGSDGSINAGNLAG